MSNDYMLDMISECYPSFTVRAYRDTFYIEQPDNAIVNKIFVSKLIDCDDSDVFVSLDNVNIDTLIIDIKSPALHFEKCNIRTIYIKYSQKYTTKVIGCNFVNLYDKTNLVFFYMEKDSVGESGLWFCSQNSIDDIYGCKVRNPIIDDSISSKKYMSVISI